MIRRQAFETKPLKSAVSWQLQMGIPFKGLKITLEKVVSSLWVNTWISHLIKLTLNAPNAQAIHRCTDLYSSFWVLLSSVNTTAWPQWVSPDTDRSDFPLKNTSCTRLLCTSHEVGEEICLVVHNILFLKTEPVCPHSLPSSLTSGLTTVGFIRKVC